MIQRWWLPTRKQCIQTHWSSCTHRTHKDFDSRDMICRRQSQKKKKQLGNGVLRENCLHSVNHVATITVSSFVHLSFCVLWTLFPWIQQSWVNVFPFWICWPVRSHQLLKKISGSSQYCWLYPRAQEKDFFAKSPCAWSQNMETSGRYWPGSVILIGYLSVLEITSEEKNVQQSYLAVNPVR